MNKRTFLQKLMVCLGLTLLPVGFYPSVYGQPATAKKIKVALVYTVTTPELKEDVVREVKNELGAEVEILTYEEPSVFEASKKIGYVTAAPAARLIGTYMQAIEDGADAILSICSTVADVAYSMQDAARYLGVPIVMINDEMCREAIRQGSRIAVMATFPTAIEPTKRTLQRLSREMRKPVELVDVLVEGGFGLDQDQFRSLMAAKAGEVADKVDVFLFAQGSMAYCEKYIADMYHKTVLSNPRFGARALKEALVAKGMM